MKVLVFLLVLGNLLFYAFSAGHFGRPGNPDAGRVEQQVAPERMRLVSRGEAPSAKAPAAPSPKAAEVPPNAPAEPVPENVCVQWAHLAPVEADRLAVLLGDKFAAFKQNKRTVAGEGSAWWVFIPPLPGKAEADKKAGELRQIGVSDYFIISEAGPNRFAISLGVFSSEKGGQDRLAELKAKGVRSARLAVRPGKDGFAVLEAKGPLADKAALLAAVAAALPKAAAQDCP